MRWVQNTVSPQRDGQGRLIAYDGLLRDITERMEAEKKLRESEEFGRQVVSSLQEGLIVFDRDLRCRSWNRFMEQLSGLAADQVLGRHPDELFPWMREQGILAGVAKALAGESLVQPDVLIHDAGAGKEIWVTGRSVPLRDAQGRIIGVITTLQDITSRKRAEEALRQLNETLEHRVAQQMREIRLLAEAVSNLGEGVLITATSRNGPDPTIVFVNQAMCHISGYAVDELVGQTPRILHGGDMETRDVESRSRASCPPAAPVSWNWPITARTARRMMPSCSSRRSWTPRAAVRTSSRFTGTSASGNGPNRPCGIVKSGCGRSWTPPPTRSSPWTGRGLSRPSIRPPSECSDTLPHELLGLDIEILIPPYCHEYSGCMARHLETSTARIIDVGRRKEGSTFPIDLVVSKINDDVFTSIIRDISERKELQQHLLEIAGEEQRRIGQELHDGIGQELTGLSLFAGTLLETLGGPGAARTWTGRLNWVLDEADFQRLRQTASRLSRGLVEANRHVHDLSHGIMPVQIDAEGLRSALQELAATTDAQQKVSCCFECQSGRRSRQQ